MAKNGKNVKPVVEPEAEPKVVKPKNDQPEPEVVIAEPLNEEQIKAVMAINSPYAFVKAFKDASQRESKISLEEYSLFAAYQKKPEAITALAEEGVIPKAQIERFKAEAEALKAIPEEVKTSYRIIAEANKRLKAHIGVLIDFSALIEECTASHKEPTVDQLKPFEALIREPEVVKQKRPRTTKTEGSNGTRAPKGKSMYAPLMITEGANKGSFVGINAEGVPHLYANTGSLSKALRGEGSTKPNEVGGKLYKALEAHIEALKALEEGEAEPTFDYTPFKGLREALESANKALVKA